MLIQDPFRREDSRLRAVAVVVLAGMIILGGGLWRLQVMAAGRYVRSEEAQSVRLVRVPAVRGKVVDRNGFALAENRPSYDVNLYLEELRPLFVQEYTNRVLPAAKARRPGGRLSVAERRDLQETARLNVYSNTVTAVSAGLGRPLPVSSDGFLRHYRQALALPLPIVDNLDSSQMALFFERCRGIPGIDLEVQAVRSYPFGRLAAHVLGHLRRSDEAENDPDLLLFRYRLKDYQGVAGVESGFDEALRGRAGVKALRVNSMGYRHEEWYLHPTELGRDVQLTIDVPIQLASERALARIAGSETRGAVVVMDVRNGDLLALVSAPAFDPNSFLGGMSNEEFAVLNDDRLRPQMNRAVSGAYAPGSIFKVIVGLAALEAGVLDPLESYEYLGYWPMGPRTPPIKDTAPAGFYDFKRAFKRSSNAYFIDQGLKAGRERIVAMSEQFGLGEKTGFPLGTEVRGYLPNRENLDRMRSMGDRWTEGDTAQLSIGQGAVAVTPLQMAVMTAAVANGGKILEPRLVLGIGGKPGEPPTTIAPKVRGELGVQARHLERIREAMLADVEEDEGTGREAAILGMRVCGKTGTAEVKKGRVLVDKITWFVAFAPFESPRYAVVVLVESGGSGGRTCAPVARQIFQAIQQREGAARPAMPSTGPAPRREASMAAPSATQWAGVTAGGEVGP